MAHRQFQYAEDTGLVTQDIGTTGTDNVVMVRVRGRCWLALGVIWLAGCPVGCPKGKPQTTFEGPVEEVHLEKLGRCTYRATPPLQHKFPLELDMKEGAYWVLMDDIPTPLDWIAYDKATAIFTIKEPYCREEEFSSFRVQWHSLVDTVNE